MPVRREHPYIWVTWLPRLLTGENSREWPVWFKAHHRNSTRTPSDFNQAEWLLNHTEFLNRRVANWEAGGFNLDTEGQNSFQLRVSSATVAGRPDLIAHRDSDAVIVDVKTGHQSGSHVVQVMIYLYAVPNALEQYRTLKIRGQVTYEDHTVRVPPESVDGRFIQNLSALIRRLAHERRAKRVPSQQECRFCDISAADCPERVDENLPAEEGTTADF